MNRRGTGMRRQGASEDTEGQLVSMAAIPKRQCMSLCKWTLKGRILLCTAASTKPVLRQDPGHGTVRGHREVSKHYELLGRFAGLFSSLACCAAFTGVVVPHLSSAVRGVQRST